jgi:hypothetical protein
VLPIGVPAAVECNSARGEAIGFATLIKRVVSTRRALARRIASVNRVTLDKHYTMVNIGQHAGGGDPPMLAPMTMACRPSGFTMDERCDCISFVRFAAGKPHGAYPRLQLSGVRRAAPSEFR